MHQAQPFLNNFGPSTSTARWEVAWGKAGEGEEGNRPQGFDGVASSYRGDGLALGVNPVKEEGADVRHAWEEGWSEKSKNAE